MKSRILYIFSACRTWVFIFACLKSGFSQTHNIGNNANIGIGGFTVWKKSSDKMLPPVGIEPGPLIPSPTLSFLH